MSVLIFYSTFVQASAKGPTLNSHNSCKVEITRAETRYNIPKGLLTAISEVESRSSPFTLNNQGSSYYFDSFHQAYYKLVSLIESGQRNIDVGCMQLNFYWHRSKFTHLSEMLIPENNIDYASRYLLSLYQTSKSWHKAVRQYHSKDNLKHKIYSRKIILAWLKEQKI